MVIREFYRTRKDGVNLYISYSDKGLQLRKVGTDEIYDDAVDVEGVPYTYEETETPIAGDVTDADYQAALREMGVNV